MTTQYTYDSSTIREELANEIAILSPMDTQLWLLLEHIPVRNTLYEWLVDQIASPTTVSAVREGFSVGTSGDVAAANRTRVRLQNVVMHDAVAVDVTDVQRLINEAGIEEEYSWQVVQKSLELLKRAEFNLHWSTYQAGTASGAPQMAGLIQWLAVTGANPGSSSVAGATVPAAFSSRWFHNSGAVTAMTEPLFTEQVLQKAWQNGVDISKCILFCGGTVKNAISQYNNVYGGSGTPLTRVNIDAERHKRVLVTDIYESDYGQLSVALDRYMTGTNGVAVAEEYTSTGGGTQGGSVFTVTANRSFFAIDPGFFQIPVLQPLEHTPIAKTGARTEGYVSMSYGFRPQNPIAGFGASDVVPA